MKKRVIVKLLDDLNKSLLDEPFEAQNMDAAIAFKNFGIETYADKDTFEIAYKSGFTGTSTRYGRAITKQLERVYGKQ